MPQFMRGVLVAAWVGFLISFFMSSFTRDAFADAQKCDALHEAPLLTLRPVIVFGMSVNFESGVLKSFPVGSCEGDLTDWLDESGFKPVVRNAADAMFVSEPAEIARYFERRKNGALINRRDLERWAPIGWSYFSVAWNSDESGRLTEIYADSEQLHFDLP